METAPRPKKIRPGEAAAAIGSTYSAVSRWISRYGDRGVKPKAEQTDGWLEFSFGDVAALAITRYLVDLGMPAHGAFSVAMRIVELRWPDLFSIDEPKWTPDKETSHMFFFLNREGNWDFGSFERCEAADVPQDSRAHIILAVGPIVNDAFRALEEMGHARPAIKKAAAEQERDELAESLAKQIKENVSERLRKDSR